MAANESVPLSWILVFVLLAIGIGATAITFLGGSVMPALLPAGV